MFRRKLPVLGKQFHCSNQIFDILAAALLSFQIVSERLAD
jgi:hypothetical protein